MDKFELTLLSAGIIITLMLFAFALSFHEETLLKESFCENYEFSAAKYYCNGKEFVCDEIPLFENKEGYQCSFVEYSINSKEKELS